MMYHSCIIVVLQLHYTTLGQSLHCTIPCQDYMSQIHRQDPYFLDRSHWQLLPLRMQGLHVPITYYHINLVQSPTFGGRLYWKLSSPRTQGSGTPCPNFKSSHKIGTKSQLLRQILWLATPIRTQDSRLFWGLQ